MGGSLSGGCRQNCCAHKESSVDSLDHKVVDDISRLSLYLSRQLHHPLYGPTEFWKTLSKKHSDLIAEYGFERFKRTVNFEYSQWGVKSLRDPKIRRLIRRIL